MFSMNGGGPDSFSLFHFRCDGWSLDGGEGFFDGSYIASTLSGLTEIPIKYTVTSPKN